MTLDVIEPRRRASVDIKLLRLELIPRGKTPCETISHEWSSAQPTENLSPEMAASSLKVDIWAAQSVVRERYRKLQKRYPPEQFSDMHLHLRPAFELLSEPVLRLNWYWQSGIIPLIGEPAGECSQSSKRRRMFSAEDALGAVISSLSPRE
jgi:hypothetical protein